MITQRGEIDESQERGKDCWSEFLEFERGGNSAQVERLAFAGSTDISSKCTSRKAANICADIGSGQ